MTKENDLLEKTLALAEDGYGTAYRFLLDAYGREPEKFGPQTLYFLACLAGGAGMPETALAWLRKAVCENGWWYRPEVLEDDDLAALRENAEFVSLKAASDSRYAAARANAAAQFSWRSRTADELFLAIHGNTQNAQTARDDWTPLWRGAGSVQIETVQSAEPDGYGTYRWSYDGASYLPVAAALGQVRDAGYRRVVCGGFSAGCDMLLRAALFSAERCDLLVLQSPWIPVLEERGEELVRALGEKDIALAIYCGADDEDCLPMARRLWEAARAGGVRAALTVQEHLRHQFPAEPYAAELPPAP